MPKAVDELLPSRSMPSEVTDGLVNRIESLATILKPAADGVPPMVYVKSTAETFTQEYLMDEADAGGSTVLFAVPEALTMLPLLVMIKFDEAMSYEYEVNPLPVDAATDSALARPGGPSISPTVKAKLVATGILLPVRTSSQRIDTVPPFPCGVIKIFGLEFAVVNSTVSFTSNAATDVIVTLRSMAPV